MIDPDDTHAVGRMVADALGEATHALAARLYFETGARVTVIVELPAREYDAWRRWSAGDVPIPDEIRYASGVVVRRRR